MAGGRPRTSELAPFGERLREALSRSPAGYSRNYLCSVTRISPSALRNYEMGTRDVPVAVLHALAAALGVTEAYLSGRSELEFVTTTPGELEDFGPGDGYVAELAELIAECVAYVRLGYGDNGEIPPPRPEWSDRGPDTNGRSAGLLLALEGYRRATLRVEEARRDDAEPLALRAAVADAALAASRLLPVLHEFVRVFARDPNAPPFPSAREKRARYDGELGDSDES